MKLDLPSVPCCSFWETQPIRSSRGGLMILATWMIQIDSSGDEDGSL